LVRGLSLVVVSPVSAGGLQRKTGNQKPAVLLRETTGKPGWRETTGRLWAKAEFLFPLFHSCGII